jgi:DeoR/GlpR family transcriptional regulator of sugar metabolism
MTLSPTKQSILDFLKLNPQTSVIKLIQHFGISKQAMHIHLSQLQSKSLVYKQGIVPRVYYSNGKQPIEKKSGENTQKTTK